MSWLIGKHAQRKGSVSIVGKIIDTDFSKERSYIHIQVGLRTFIENLEDCIIFVEEREALPPLFPLDRPEEYKDQHHRQGCLS